VGIGSLAVAAVYLGAFFWLFGGPARWPGSNSYEQLARHLSDGQGYSVDGVNPTALRPPLYPLILAATMRATADGWFPATVVLQALAAAVCLMLVFDLARACWPQSTAPWLSAGLLALHGPFMFEMLSLRETAWFTLALLGVAWLLLRGARTAASAVALGILLACLYLLRPTGLMVWGVTLAFLGWSAVQRQTGARRRLAIVLIASLVVVAPWQAFTWRNFGAPGFFPASSNGYNLFKGADPELTGVLPWIDADSLDSQLGPLAGNIPAGNERASDREFRRLAIGLIREKPATMIGRSALSAAEFLSPLPIPLGTGTSRNLGTGSFGNAGGAIVIDDFRPDWAEVAFAPIVVALLVSAYGGLRQLWRRRGDPRWLGLWIVVVFLSFLTIHALTFTKTRYRLPLDALLAIPAGGWLAGLKRHPSALAKASAE
jgi:hypothetical protein